MSFTPTYWLVLPLARVETISLGKPIGSAHGGSGNSRSASAAQRNHAIDFVFRGQARQDYRRAFGHGRDGFTTIAPSDKRRKTGTSCASNLLARHIRFHFRRFERANVDDERRVAALPDQFGDEPVFLTFGVHGAENCNGGHADDLAVLVRRSQRFWRDGPLHDRTQLTGVAQFGDEPMRAFRVSVVNDTR